MRRIRTTAFLVFGLLSSSLWWGFALAAAIAPGTGRQADDRSVYQRAYNTGNFKEAYDGFRKLCLESQTSDSVVVSDLRKAVECLNRLDRIQEVDELLEKTVAAHPKKWRVLNAVAEQYIRVGHKGNMVAGRFERRSRWREGPTYDSSERDRIRAWQLMSQAEPLLKAAMDQADNPVRPPEAGQFYLSLARILIVDRDDQQQSWRLQHLSDLKELPDYEEEYADSRSLDGAAVDAEGNPIFHEAARRFEEAKTDGQRWRWCLSQAVEVSPSLRNAVQRQIAQFSEQQFGVQTMTDFLWDGWDPRLFAAPPSDDSGDDKNESGVFALPTLKEDETVAQLATGIKRFKLPPEYNYIKIYQRLADQRDRTFAEQALEKLANFFQNRLQFPRAAEYWRKSINTFGPGRNDRKRKQLEQIVGAWGRFETVMTQPAGKGAAVEFRFRNGKQVSFQAHQIKVAQLLSDVKAYLKASTQRVESRKVDLADIGWRLVQNNETKYIGRRVAQWDLDLNPREKHFDRRITVTTPLQKSGAYLLTAKMKDGNTSKIVLWIADTVIVHTRLSQRNYYFVADSVTGRPIADANVEFFGYQQLHLQGNRYRILTTNFAETTDKNGQVLPDPRDLNRQYQWLVVAQTRDGRFAFHGFRRVWSDRNHDDRYDHIKIFPITDRPVYRPGQKVRYKFWVQRVQYDKAEKSQFAHQSFPVRVFNPKREKRHTETLQADEYGGVEGVFEIPQNAALGRYWVELRVGKGRRSRIGRALFRVEEYKKPEFEVTVEAPQDPVMLGEKITAKIQARYFFGSPVAHAAVKYTVMREEYSRPWFPVAPWDWCYGPGYWWFAYDYPWYPGWRDWAGCLQPNSKWSPYGLYNPPELVLQREAEIGPDGQFELEIDTALAKEMHGDLDHRYVITAEVRDQSRRTIVGTGKVLVARKPFKVFTWLDRGYHRVGDIVQAHFKAQTLDRKPVQGKGVATLYKITYDKDRRPQETAVCRWPLDTNDEGRADLKLTAARQGQYRLAYRVTDAKEHTIEGGYIFTITGAGFDGRDYRFSALELIPEKKEYQPGETVRVRINTDRVDSTVLLFVRPADGVYLPPRVLRISGKSVVQTIDVVKKDIPNFFVEAVTITDGQVHSVAKEIAVPPESRVLNVAVLPSEKEYKPGQKAKVKVQLTTFNGEKFQGSTVLTVYDKAVEYISGGVNTTGIKEFFWQWRRRHYPSQQSSLDRFAENLTPRNSTQMADIGVFGVVSIDELENMRLGPSGRAFGFGGGGFGGRFGGGFFGGPASGGMGGLGESTPFVTSIIPAVADSSVGGGFGRSGIAPSEQEASDADLVQPTVRTNFADTALWVGAVTTNQDGVAEFELTMPENLTTWKIRTWALGHGTRVGEGQAEVVTRKNLIVRLQSPRFFVQKDEVVLSANVHNYLTEDKEAKVVLELPGEELEPLGDLTVTTTIPAGGEKRIDWRVRAVREGLAVVRMKALTDEESDATQVKIPCYVHGILKTEAWSGTVKPDDRSAKLTIQVPAERRIEQSVLEIRYSPSLAAAMVDALPYLAEFPYGCTEQTLNRFLPSVITQKVLLEMGLDLAAIKEKRTNLNAQEIGDDRQRAAQWKRFDRNPVFDELELQRMVKEGVKELTAMQLADGGWGWFGGFRERSFPHTTAVVVHGLQLARHNDVALVPEVLQRGVAWLERYQNQQILKLNNAPKKTKPYKTHADNLDALVYMVLADADKEDAQMRTFLYRDRKELAVYAKAMFGLALEKIGDRGKLTMILRNIRQFLVEDAENETAYLKLPADNYWWYWYGSETEANAYYLKLLAKTRPKGNTARRLVKYLLNNRKHATYWKSTRDTAICVEAFADYLRASDELSPDMVVELWLDGEKVKETAINSKNLFTFDNKLVLTGANVKNGSHDIEIRRRGKGPVYFNAYLTNFTLEDPISKAGLEVRVQRKFYKLEPVKKTIKAEGRRGQALDQRVEKYRRVPLDNLATVESGDLVEVELEIESKNDYEYLMFEDKKAAGLEPIDVRSGYVHTGLHAYMEVRDDRVTFFIHRLARGKHSVSYRLWAETPGKFSALPALASAMYAPELRGNSNELKLHVIDEETAQD